MVTEINEFEMEDSFQNTVVCVEKKMSYLPVSGGTSWQVTYYLKKNGNIVSRSTDDRATYTDTETGTKYRRIY